MGIYLDYGATSPPDPRVAQVMRLGLVRGFGNPSSRDHAFGWDAADAVEEARGHVAALIGADPTEITFTGSATESINCALRGVVTAPTAKQMVTAATEHDAVLETCRLIEARSYLRLHVLTTDRKGCIEVSAVAAACESAQTAFVSVMLANNEIGTLHPIRRFADAAHATGAIVFSDLTQAAGKVAIDVRDLRLDMAAFSAHKLYGPKGVGALFIRGGEPKVTVEPLIVGGGHERGMRAGTLNVPGIVGFGEACRIAHLALTEDAARVSKLRDKLEAEIVGAVPDVWINGDMGHRLPNTTNIGFRGVDARTLIRDMHDIAVSTKSACSSGDARPSHVLKAIGLTDDEAYSCIRFSLGRFTTEAETDYAVAKVVASTHRLRENMSARM